MVPNRAALLKAIMKYLHSEEVEKLYDGGLSIFRGLHTSVKRLLNPPLPTQKTFLAEISPPTQFSSYDTPVKHFPVPPNPVRTKFNFTAPPTLSSTQNTMNMKPLISFEEDLGESPSYNITNPFSISNFQNTQKNEPSRFAANCFDPFNLEDLGGGNTESSFKLQNLKIREFKISGTIGSAGQKDRINYTSLAYQIDNGMKQGFSETDIKSAIIKAISPGSALRSYFEGRRDLNLKQMMKFLRNHFKEKNATSLFTDLANAVQDLNESAQDFVIRLMSLRQKILAVSMEEDEFPYDERLVKQRFVYAVGTGLRNENVRQGMKSILNMSSSDEDILQKLNDLMSEEQEHVNKVKKRVDVIKVDASVVKDPPDQTQNILKQINELRTQLDKLVQSAPSSLINNGTTGSAGGNTQRTGVFYRTEYRRCQDCVSVGNFGRCVHCFRCGSETHRVADCPVPGTKN